MMKFKCQYNEACTSKECGTCVFNTECINCVHINDKELTECLECARSPISASGFIAYAGKNDTCIRKRYFELIKQHDGQYGEILCEMMNKYKKMRLPDITDKEVKEFYEENIVNGTGRA